MYGNTKENPTKCDNCIYYDTYKNPMFGHDVGICKKNSPNYKFPGWPHVRPEDWCGEIVKITLRNKLGLV